MNLSWDFLLNPVPPSAEEPGLKPFDRTSIEAFRKKIAEYLGCSTDRIAFLKGSPGEQKLPPTFCNSALPSMQKGSAHWYLKDLQFPHGFNKDHLVYFESFFMAGFSGLTLAVLPLGLAVKDSAHPSLIQALESTLNFEPLNWEDIESLALYAQSLFEIEIPGLQVRSSEGIPNLLVLTIPGANGVSLTAKLKEKGIHCHPPMSDENLILSFSPFWSQEEMDISLGTLIPVLRHLIGVDDLAPMPQAVNFPKPCSSCDSGCSSGGCSSGGCQSKKIEK